jgi:hypothetical protein
MLEVSAKTVHGVNQHLSTTADRFHREPSHQVSRCIFSVAIIFLDPLHLVFQALVVSHEMQECPERGKFSVRKSFKYSAGCFQ